MRIKKRENHGIWGIKLYWVWKSMRERCYNLNSPEYNRYGGRGIAVCNEWINSFALFHEWCISNGYSDGLSLDRIDNDGDYKPSNCRFTTPTMQSINQRLRCDNKSGYKGIDFLQSKGKWRSRIKLNGVEYSLGNHATIQEAISARNSFIIENDLPHKLQEYMEA